MWERGLEGRTGLVGAWRDGSKNKAESSQNVIRYMNKTVTKVY